MNRGFFKEYFLKTIDTKLLDYLGIFLKDCRHKNRAIFKDYGTMIHRFLRVIATESWIFQRTFLNDYRYKDRRVSKSIFRGLCYKNHGFL